MKKSAFTLKKGSDSRFPYVVAFQGIGGAKFRTKKEAIKRLEKVRKKERDWIKKNIK